MEKKKGVFIQVFFLCFLTHLVSVQMVSYARAILWGNISAPEQNGNTKQLPLWREPFLIGTASWYGREGRHVKAYTASGEYFDDSKKTCASWYFDFGTRLKVTNLKNGKSLICRVNDRGPARRLNRLIDLSKASFKQIGDLKEGLIPVSIRPVN